MFGTYLRLGLSVYATPREVIEATRRKFKKKARRNPKFRAGRKEAYRAMLAHHDAAMGLCKEYAQ